jgi:hypothetical protein
MRANPRRLLAALLLSAASMAARTALAQPAAADITDKLKAIPGVVDVTIGNGRGGGRTYDVTIEQPLDHANPAAGTFRQHFYVANVDPAKPVLLGTEGYAANGVGGGELQAMLAGNQVTVEHRYFGKSAPAAPIEWKYLTVKNAADDMHAIVSGLKKIYTGKWVSTGTSKGGQTSLFYKCYYPDDVDATVAYVAPVNIGQEDPRINIFINTVGDDATRNKIKAYQIALFKREDEILPLVKAQADQRRWTFGMGLPKAYEYGVLEYPYAFWQYGSAAADIPAPDAPAETLAATYNKVGTLRYYSDQGKKQFEPFLYQAFTENRLLQLRCHRLQILHERLHLQGRRLPHQSGYRPPRHQGKNRLQPRYHGLRV